MRSAHKYHAHVIERGSGLWLCLRKDYIAWRFLAMIGRMEQQVGLPERMKTRFRQVGESVAAMAQGFPNSRDQAP